MAFFAQVLVAEAASIGVAGLLHRKGVPSARSKLAISMPLAGWFFLVGIAAVITSFYAPPLKIARAKGTFPGPVELLRRPNAADAFYATFGPLKPYLAKDDIVLLQNTLEGYALATTTGARCVVVIFGFYVPDYAARARDVDRFLSPGVSLMECQAILNCYDVSHILPLSEDNSNVADEMKAQFGPALFENEKLILFRVLN